MAEKKKPNKGVNLNTRPKNYQAVIKIVGVGGGGNKMANAFIELGYNKTLLVNTTGKDIPKNVEEDQTEGYTCLLYTSDAADE